MKFFNIKAVGLALSLSVLSIVSAHASTLILSPDLNPNSFAEQYQFSNSFIQGENFADIINLDITPLRDLVVSFSGTSGGTISFSKFDLYSGFSDGANTFVQTGDVNSPLPTMTFGSLVASTLAGNYFIKIEGMQTGFGTYNGNISLTSQPSMSEVPLPATLPLMAGGLGLLGFAKRRKLG